MFALFFLHFVPFFSDWLNFVAQELKPKEKIYLVNKLHASCRLSHSAHIKTLRKTITITKRCWINGVFLDGPVLLCSRYDHPVMLVIPRKLNLFYVNSYKMIEKSIQKWVLLAPLLFIMNVVLDFLMKNLLWMCPT